MGLIKRTTSSPIARDRKTEKVPIAWVCPLYNPLEAESGRAKKEKNPGTILKFRINPAYHEYSRGAYNLKGIMIPSPFSLSTILFVASLLFFIAPPSRWQALTRQLHVILLYYSIFYIYETWTLTGTWIFEYASLDQVAIQR